MQPKPVTLQNLFTEIPLYQLCKAPFEDLKQQSAYIFSILHRDSSIDMYCKECKSHSIFIFEKLPHDGSIAGFNGKTFILIENADYHIIVKCSRNSSHKATMLLKHERGSLLKIGQYPSLADIITPDLKRYIKAIGEDRVKEWSRSIGLAAHGIGAGSFVYLRRIIEFLIEEAHQLAKNQPAWNEEDYTQQRVQEKIGMLRGFIPEFIVENRITYGILSKGIHELDEVTCLEHFPVLNTAIKIIAEEKKSKLEIEKLKTDAQTALSKVANQIK